MTPLVIGLITLCIVFSGALVGMLINRLLPPHHVSSQTQTAVTVATAVVGTMSALVLGLLISSTNMSFSTRNAEIDRISADVIRLDRVLHRYGTDADDVRAALQHYAAVKLAELFPGGNYRKPNMDDPKSANQLEAVQDAILLLKPADDRQHWLQTEALQLAAEISETRWLLALQNASSIPSPFLILLVFWLTLLFTSFGLFAPRNVTATVALFLCAAAVSSGIGMVLEMDHPYDGIVQLSTAPLRHALDIVGR